MPSRRIRRFCFYCLSEHYPRISNVKRGRDKYCSTTCSRRAKRKHGSRRYEIYNTWKSMWYRCTNPKDKKYYCYGGKGIAVCDRWKDIKNFVEDMGPKPKGLTLDRIDSNGDYTPGNCRWATDYQQVLNRDIRPKNYYWNENLKKYQVMMRFNGELHNFGYFANEKEAQQKAQELRQKHKRWEHAEKQGLP